MANYHILKLHEIPNLRDLSPKYRYNSLFFEVFELNESLPSEEKVKPVANFRCTNKEPGESGSAFILETTHLVNDHPLYILEFKSNIIKICNQHLAGNPQPPTSYALIDRRIPIFLLPGFGDLPSEYVIDILTRSVYKASSHTPIPLEINRDIFKDKQEVLITIPTIEGDKVIKAPKLYLSLENYLTHILSKRIRLSQLPSPQKVS